MPHDGEHLEIKEDIAVTHMPERGELQDVFGEGGWQMEMSPEEREWGDELMECLQSAWLDDIQTLLSLGQEHEWDVPKAVQVAWGVRLVARLQQRWSDATQALIILGQEQEWDMPEGVKAAWGVELLARLQQGRSGTQALITLGQRQGWEMSAPPLGTSIMHHVCEHNWQRATEILRIVDDMHVTLDDEITALRAKIDEQAVSAPTYDISPEALPNPLVIEDEVVRFYTMQSVQLAAMQLLAATHGERLDTYRELAAKDYSYIDGIIYRAEQMTLAMRDWMRIVLMHVVAGRANRGLELGRPTAERVRHHLKQMVISGKKWELTLQATYDLWRDTPPPSGWVGTTEYVIACEHDNGSIFFHAQQLGLVQSDDVVGEDLPMLKKLLNIKRGRGDEPTYTSLDEIDDGLSERLEGVSVPDLTAREFDAFRTRLCAELPELYERHRVELDAAAAAIDRIAHMKLRPKNSGD